VIGLPSLQAMDRAQGARIWLAGMFPDSLQQWTPKKADQ
jgi:hypothetical protein